MSNVTALKSERTPAASSDYLGPAVVTALGAAGVEARLPAARSCGRRWRSRSRTDRPWRTSCSSSAAGTRAT